jgi:hypothetical protein
MTQDDYPYDFFHRSDGITFHLPSRRRFIPSSWLLHADLNEKGTELQIHYTHSLVTINGTNLQHLHEEMAKSMVSWVREMAVPQKNFDRTVTRIEITEKAEV